MKFTNFFGVFSVITVLVNPEFSHYLVQAWVIMFLLFLISKAAEG